ncbi:MAG: ABC transporter ATP-binding protein [Firmicutes bacterium]|jgi:ABC-type nitrate/sulfonate/bicarbonate transport system ATPase subunit|nr:ABC transporter ATP-binding protein [Bacillota bacterium]
MAQREEKLQLPYLEVKGVSHSFNLGTESLPVLSDISFTLDRGQATAVVGPSGCGKTTLLRLIAGLAVPAAGSILVQGKLVETTGRDRTLVFQEPRLFPWLTVAQNAAFGLRDVTPVSRLPLVEAALKLVGLEDFADAYPHQLSGGMAQRVALARALAPQPELLLLDEPFAALDAFTRSRLQKELVNLWRTTGCTLLVVTHDIEEALYLAERVIILSARPGQIKEVMDVPLPYPRDRTGAKLHQLRRYILNQLEG